MSSPVKMQNKPTVVSVSSHVAKGSVGNRASVFALEAFGFPVCAVPTVVMPWHPGHGPSHRLVHGAEVFRHLIEEISGAPWIGDVGGILTGYFADVPQVKAMAELIKLLKSRNKEVVYLCDPVMGDAEGLYVAEEIAVAIRDLLLPLCDIATPNIHELAWLVGCEDVQRAEDVKLIARSFGDFATVITSVEDEYNGRIGNLWVDSDDAYLAMHERIDNPPNGTGDLFAATLLARLLAGNSPKEALKYATAAVFEILNLSTKAGSDELTLAGNAASLLAPEDVVEIMEY